MRRMLVAAVLLLGVLLVQVGCMKSYDEISQVGVAEWYPEMAVPLVSETVEYGKLFAVNNSHVRFYAGPDQELILEYHHGDTAGMPVCADLFTGKSSDPETARPADISIGLFDNVPYGVIDAPGVRLVYRLSGFPLNKKPREVLQNVHFDVTGELTGSCYNYPKNEVMKITLNKLGEWRGRESVSPAHFKYRGDNFIAGRAGLSHTIDGDMHYYPDKGYVEFALDASNSDIVSIFKGGLYEVFNNGLSIKVKRGATDLWDSKLKEEYKAAATDDTKFPGLRLQAFLEIPMKDVTVRPLLMVKTDSVKNAFKDLPDGNEELYNADDMKVSIGDKSGIKLYLKTLNSVENATAWCTFEYGGGTNFTELDIQGASTVSDAGSDTVKTILKGLHMKGVVTIKKDGDKPTFQEIPISLDEYKKLRKADCIRINFLLMTEGKERATFRKSDNIWVNMALTAKPKVSYR